MQYYYEVAPTKIARAGSDVFTYHSERQLHPGHIVLVELGKKQIPAIVVRAVTAPTYATKQIMAPIETTPLPLSLVETALWLHAYYATPLATVLQTVLPRGLIKQRRKRQRLPHVATRNRTHFVLNNHQKQAVNTILDMSPGSALLHGVTGSGKTAVYIELAKHTIQEGKSVIILVPEIALTSQLVDDFSNYFPDVSVVHSKQTEAERHNAWRDALTSQTPRVIIGPRSALFTPVPNLGLIVIDEAHEPSFKQEQSPRYSALRAASILATTAGAKAVFGSATPLVSDYFLAEQSNRPIITLPLSAREDATPPTITVVDLTKKDSLRSHRFLSDKLINTIRQTIEQGQQSLLFHNRRGSANTTLCENCGWTALCPRCIVPFTLHTDTHRLECHICGTRERVPTSCPECYHADIMHKGIGTKLIESELAKLFPKATIARFDGDTDAINTVENKYKDLYSGSIDIIVGTQVIAKGLDLPHLRTVGVVQADAGLSLPDYGASERTFQLLAQVVGRVGRSHHATDVIVQSYQPTHPAIHDGIRQDYAAFYQTTIAERRRAKFPPFTYLLRLTCVYKTEAAAVRNARQLAVTLKQAAPEHTLVLGPTPAFYEYQHGTFRWQLLVKSPKRSDLVALLSHVPAAHWQADLDPSGLL